MNQHMVTDTSTQIYRDDDKPLYRRYVTAAPPLFLCQLISAVRGNKVLIAFCVYNAALYIGAKVFYVRVNA